MTRGEIWWTDFGDPRGSESGYRRPSVIVSSARFNRSRIAAVIVSAVTSNMRLAEAPGNVPIQQGDAGLDRPSVVNVSQTLVIDRSRLVERAGGPAPHVIRRVDDGPRPLLAL